MAQTTARFWCWGFGAISMFIYTWCWASGARPPFRSPENTLGTKASISHSSLATKISTPAPATQISTRDSFTLSIDGSNNGLAGTASQVEQPTTSVLVGTPHGEKTRLCSGVSSTSPPAQFPGNNFCPAPVVQYMMQEHTGVAHRSGDPSASRLSGMLYLDALFVLATIGTKHQLSWHVVNFGADPSSLGEDDRRAVVAGDDTTALNYAGWNSLNYDVPQFASSTQPFYAKWERAKVDVSGSHPPAQIAEHMRSQGVPVDFDFLKIDIDSFECEYLEAILVAGFKPKVLDVELASSYPPPIRFRAKYTPGLSVAVTPMGGCSLQEAVHIVAPFGYTLIQYPLQDGWFVRNEYLELFGPLETDPETLFYRGNPYLYGAWGVFPGTEGVLAAMAERAPAETILNQIKKAHEVVFAARPDLRSGSYTLSIDKSSGERQS